MLISLVFKPYLLPVPVDLVFYGRLFPTEVKGATEMYGHTHIQTTSDSKKFIMNL